MGLTLGLSLLEKNQDWGYSREKYWGEYFELKNNKEHENWEECICLARELCVR
jgi:hypothetical protein